MIKLRSRWLPRRQSSWWLLLTALLLSLTSGTSTSAQESPNTVITPPCVLAKQIYTCDGPAFQKRLASAKVISIETHSIDKYAQAQLRNLVTKKLGKVLAAENSPADLIVLLIPLDSEGMNLTPGESGLGTLRIYTASPENTRGQLIWAEVFTGHEDMPWPAVVNGVIFQFQSHFHLK